MKHLVRFAAALAVIVLALSGCKKNKEIGSRSQLIGRWQYNKEYIVFYDESAEDEGYSWGKEWNEAEGVYESDLDGEDEHGNGWFKWKKGDDYIRVATMMSISEANPALDWSLNTLTDTEMSLAQKNKQFKTYKKVDSK